MTSCRHTKRSRHHALLAFITVGHWLSFLGAWTFDPALAAGLGMAAVLYAWGARTVSARHPDTPWSGRRSAYFLSGTALLWVVLQGPTGVFDDTFFWAHMVQHIVLVMVCAPLLLLGAPVLLVLRVSSPQVRRKWVVPVLRSRLAYALANPVTTWLVLAVVIVGTHFTPVLRARARALEPAPVRGAPAVPGRRAALLLSAAAGEPRTPQGGTGRSGAVAGPDDGARDHDRFLHLRLPLCDVPLLRPRLSTLRTRSSRRPAAGWCPHVGGQHADRCRVGGAGRPCVAAQ